MASVNRVIRNDCTRVGSCTCMCPDELSGGCIGNLQKSRLDVRLGFIDQKIFFVGKRISPGSNMILYSVVTNTIRIKKKNKNL